MSTPLVRGVRTAAMAPRFVLIGIIRLYQLTLSPLLGPRCKFYPSCSHYGLEALRTHGAIVGTALSAWRVLRCNPFSNGGVDDVPMRGERLFRLHRNNRRALDLSAPPARPSSVSS